MYLVKTYDGPEDKEGLVVHSPYISEVKLTNPSVDLKLTDISSMSFSTNMKNPAWNRIRPLKTLVRVFRSTDGKKLFDGRVLTPSQKMGSSGMFHVDYVCEDRKAYLHDSSQRHGEYHDITVRGFLDVILNNHNRQVEPHKQFKLGTVTVDSSTSTIYRYLGYESTFDSINDKLIDRLGGYIVIRDEEDGMYLDYLAEVGEVKETPIRMAFNMQDLKRDIDPTNVITRLVPLGARIESEDETATDASQARVDITSVNGGKDYLDDTLLIEEFGVIEGTLLLDDVNDKGMLKTRGQQYLATQKASTVQIDTTALNIDLLDGQSDVFEVGNYHPVDNPILNIQEPVQIIGMTIDLEQPQKFKLNIGDKQQTLSQYQAEVNKQVRMVGEMQSRVSSLGEANVRLSQSLNVAKNEVEKVRDDLNNINFDELPVELQRIAQNLISLQGAIDDIDSAIAGIPNYAPANSTKDGLLTSNLYMKLVAIDSVNATRNGLMLKEDKIKLDKITVTKAVDLDNIISRIEALENI